MPNVKPPRVLGAVALVTFFALSAAAQQAPGTGPSPPAEKPPMAKPESAPTPSPETPTTPPKSSESNSPLVGLTAISSDGSKIGDVRAVRATPDGKVTALRVRSGGLLGFGGRIVEIPEGKFTHTGDTVRVSLTAEEVSKLPAVRDASGSATD